MALGGRPPDLVQRILALGRQAGDVARRASLLLVSHTELSPEPFCADKMRQPSDSETVAADG